MKVVILAGGKGTRLGGETILKPKPMVEIGEKPIIWHIMNTYAKYGFKEFIICGGYKQGVIKQYFNDYMLLNSDVTFDFKNNTTTYHNNACEDWKVTIVDTGRESLTGTRIKRIKSYVGDEPFLLTYGDGLCNVNINDVIKYHNEHKAVCTLTAVQPSGKFGLVSISDNGNIKSFKEKPVVKKEWINGGYFVCEKEVFDYIGEEDVMFETAPIERIAKDGKLFAYKFDGFWKCMDTQKDKLEFEEMWANGDIKWME